MTQAGYRHRILVIDHSASIKTIVAGQQSGLRELIDSEAALPGTVTFSLWQFDDEIECVHSFAAADQVRDYLIVPHGMTAMYDAIADAVIAEGVALAALAEDERPEDVTVLIASDGLENASKRFTGTEVAELLRVQKDDYSWRVLYMGTNQDALKEGEKFGVVNDSSLDYHASDAGSANAWKMSAHLMSRAPVASAAPGGQGFSYNEAERAVAASDEDSPSLQGGEG